MFSRQKLLTATTALTLACSLGAQTTPQIVNLNTYAKKCANLPNAPRYCLAGIRAAIADAVTWMGANQGDYVIAIDPGPVDLTAEVPTADHPGYFDFSGVMPQNGVLTLQGAGPALTQIITKNGYQTIIGYGVSHLHFEGITFLRDSLTVTQGTFVGSSTNNGVTAVSLMIQPGFPLPNIPGPITGGPAYPAMRVYDNTNPLDPRIIPAADNEQVYWDFSKTQCGAPTKSGTPCTLTLFPSQTLSPYYAVNPNWLIGLKIETEENAVNFNGLSNGVPGTDVAFTNIDWMDAARLQLQYMSNIQIVGNNILRRAALHNPAFMGGFQSPAMSSPSGGPQIGQAPLNGFVTTGVLVKDFTAMGTGDDSLALFWLGDSPSSTVTNTTITSSFARTINTFQSCSVHFNRNSGNQCTQWPNWGFPSEYQFCISDTTTVNNNPSPCLVPMQ